MGSMEEKREANIWEMPSGLPAVQSFLRPNLHHLSSYVSDPSLHHQGQNLRMTLWTTKCRVRMNIYDQGTLLAVKYGAHSLLVIQSSIRHEQARLGVISQSPFRSSEIIDYYYGNIVCSDMQGQLGEWKRYGKDIIEVNMRMPEKWSLKVPMLVEDMDGVKTSVWIMSAPFCIIKFVKHARLLPADETSVQVQPI